ncbi:MAG: trypsin-like serine protease [Halioglobus sp.]|nr:trypsin-like serine protease [Halioglobus sp.]
MPIVKPVDRRSRCDRAHQYSAPRGAQSIGLLLLGLLLCTGDSAADSREIYSDASPTWLRAVGKLQVPGSRYRDGRRRHYTEDCSATLVARKNAVRSATIVTAWHCLEYYNDLSRSITFTALPGTAHSIRTDAVVVAHGGGMHADWAILRLRDPIPAGAIRGLELPATDADRARTVTMAGYSRDSGKGDNGGALTYDGRCLVTAYREDGATSNCAAYRGASGGAVVRVSARGDALLAGVISRGDSRGTSVYVPVAQFRRAVTLLLEQ